MKKNGELLNSLKRLCEKGFEENLMKRITPNRWRFLFKRIPLSEIKDFSYTNIKNIFEEILDQLNAEDDFKKELL